MNQKADWRIGLCVQAKYKHDSNNLPLLAVVVDVLPSCTRDIDDPNGVLVLRCDRPRHVQNSKPFFVIDGADNWVTSESPVATSVERPAAPEFKMPFSMDTAESEPEPQDTDWEDAIEQCNRIMEMCNEVPERGEDFAYSVQQKVQEISETIEESERVTEAQQIALDNMESGVSRWIE